MSGSMVLIQLMARWSSDVVLRYVAEAPLECLSEAYRKSASQVQAARSADDVLQQIATFRGDMAADKAALAGFEQELHDIKKAQENRGFQSENAVKKQEIIVNSESGVAHRAMCFSTSVPSRHWRTFCGWSFGASLYEVSSTLPSVGSRVCGRCFRFEKLELVRSHQEGNLTSSESSAS